MPISQAQYEHLINLLQNLNVSSLVPTSTTNQISTNHNQGDQNPGIICNNTYNTSELSNKWILHSGANDHVCSSLNLFNSYYKIEPIKITLPNGNCIMVHYDGNNIFTYFVS